MVELDGRDLPIGETGTGHHGERLLGEAADETVDRCCAGEHEACSFGSNVPSTDSTEARRRSARRCSAPVTPGTVYEADVEIWPFSIVAPAGYQIGLSVRGQDYTHGLPGAQESVYGRELLGSGAYWHELPGDRDNPVFDGRTTLVGTADRRPYVLLPVIPRA
ncbi:CocE/NonD family hydrolase C-terminal non-catalytic domain-containing protein [Nocardia brasiliensis]|uniref:CocE/NonD family hydrolase C-terminal non-catalytic domain-containing protein n=1 Tax=Nocardia brasiliensis TaxID=37326 RepID=UPI0021148E1C|nr:CocE/NonD family hydrolase C-terminal non-catalytic domain-containing protein [Nocardia brasiliensis]